MLHFPPTQRRGQNQVYTTATLINKILQHCIRRHTQDICVSFVHTRRDTVLTNRIYFSLHLHDFAMWKMKKVFALKLVTNNNRKIFWRS